MRSGCVSLFVRIGVVVAAAVIAAGSLALIASFAVSALGQPSGFSGVIATTVAIVAGLCFVLVGRSIWTELTEKKRPEEGRDGSSDSE